MKDNRGSLHRIEADVEEEYLNNLRTNCYRERSYKEGLMYKARSFRDQELEERAKNMKTPSCLQLTELSRKYASWG
ncbi:dnaJ subfamily B member 12-like protein [Leptotrombidium deliense]|uniref:DnaJ subfamily B member 12-like protein n=1 Tax=Leptotrombidium deliense TaxID=299467 RepID=A0A443RYK9_9ACAR|nr:dnaJ subfamily B member 12-like protein [Leptotrombidium deliense]